MKQIIRYGAYGILVKDNQILLTQKKSGPYLGLWGLPGGAIEFGETPEQALIRELEEETALSIAGLNLLNIATATGDYTANQEPYSFHQVGLIYTVKKWEKKPNVVPEELNRWFSLINLDLQDLTPFAKHALSTIS